MALAKERLVTRAPFHLQATVRVLQRRPVNRVDVWDDDRYLRVLPVANGHVLAAVTNRGTLARPDLCFSFLAASPRTARRETTGRSRQVAERLGAIIGRLVERFGQAVEYRGRLFYAPPDSQAIAGARPAALRACGLSARKADALMQREGTFDDRVRRFGELRGYLYFLGLGGSLLRMGLIDAAGKESAWPRRS